MPTICIVCKTECLAREMSRSRAYPGWCMRCTDRLPRRGPPASDRTSFIPAHALVGFRARYGLSQRACADILGCAVPTVSHYETGKTPVPKYIAMAISAYIACLPPYTG